MPHTTLHYRHGDAGLAATAEVVQLNATLTHLAAQRGALVASAPPPYFSPLIDQLQEHSAETGDGIAEVVRRLEVTRAQKSEGEAYRGAPLCYTPLRIDHAYIV